MFDNEANVYVATSPTVRGLVIKAASLDEIRAEVEKALPELLTLNHLDNELRNHKHIYISTPTLMPHKRYLSANNIHSQIARLLAV